MSEKIKTIALFPGQGSQKVGMGKALFEECPLAKGVLEAADVALGFKISEILLNGPETELTRTEIAQPAILTVSVACFESAKANLHESYQIVAAAGHSLGEYSALVAAGAIDFSDAVRLVHKRGQYMQSAVPLGQGKMVAVIGKELAEIEAALTKATGVAEVANINAPGQVVVAGDVSGVTSFVAALGKARVIELQVSAPFHCSLMKPAQDQLWEDLKTIKISPPRFPVYSNFLAEPASDPEGIRQSLRQQVCGRVRWAESVQNMVSQHHPTSAHEFGHGEVLTNMLKRIAPQLKTVGHPTMSKS